MKFEKTNKVLYTHTFKQIKENFSLLDWCFWVITFPVTLPFWLMLRAADILDSYRIK